MGTLSSLFNPSVRTLRVVDYRRPRSSLESLRITSENMMFTETVETDFVLFENVSQMLFDV